MTDFTGSRMGVAPALRIGLAAIVIAFTVDQITKLTALALLSRGEIQSLLPFLDFRLSFNEGVSFGIFAQAFAGRPLVLAAITFAVVILLAAILFRSSSWKEAAALGAVIGGALGNILDRVRIGAVVDFIDLHLWGHHWPAFNIADSAIVVGISAFVLASFASGPRTAVR